MTHRLPSQDRISDRSLHQLAGHDLSPEATSIRAARGLMTAAIAYRGAQEPERLALAEALAVLNDVAPPYPPLPPVQPLAPSTDLRELTELVLEHLRVALDEIGDIAELTRVATASIVLRRGGGVAA